MTRRQFLEGVAALGVASTALGQEARKPNIIWIMADDLGVYDVGYLGQKHIQTPNIDRIAAEGMQFTQAYAGSTVCAPARSTLMTGLHTGHTTVRGNFSAIGKGRVPLAAEDVTVAEVLKQAGYATGIVGKWGLGEPDTPGIPNRQGFDFWFGFLNQKRAHSYYPDYLWRNETQVPLNPDKSRKDYAHDLMTEEALGFVKRCGRKPFFLYLAYTIPHAKYEVPSLEPYADKDWSDKEKTYAAMITRMDRDIGRLMALLKQQGVDDDTLVFFCSDNGAAERWKRFESCGPLRGRKRDMYEGGIRVPMAARWPGKVKAGSKSDTVWAFWDFLPTAAEVAGAPPPKNIDGISILPSLLGQEQKARHEFLYWEFHEGGYKQAVRRGKWKAVRNTPGKPLEIYDLEADPGEAKDVANAQPDVVAKIEAYLETARTVSEHWPGRAAKPRKK